MNSDRWDNRPRRGQGTRFSCKGCEHNLVFHKCLAREGCAVWTAHFPHTVQRTLTRRCGVSDSLVARYVTESTTRGDAMRPLRVSPPRPVSTRHKSFCVPPQHVVHKRRAARHRQLSPASPVLSPRDSVRSDNPGDFNTMSWFREFIQVGEISRQAIHSFLSPKGGQARHRSMMTLAVAAPAVACSESPCSSTQLRRSGEQQQVRKYPPAAFRATVQNVHCQQCSAPESDPAGSLQALVRACVRRIVEYALVGAGGHRERCQGAHSATRDDGLGAGGRVLAPLRSCRANARVAIIGRCVGSPSLLAAISRACERIGPNQAEAARCVSARPLAVVDRQQLGQFPVLHRVGALWSRKLSRNPPARLDLRGSTSVAHPGYITIAQFRCENAWKLSEYKPVENRK